MNKYYGALAYEDEKLTAIVYNSFEGQQYVIANEEVYSGDITKVTGVDASSSIGKKLNDVLGEVEEELGVRIHRLDLIIDPSLYDYEPKSFEVEFDTMHSITADDIKQIVSRAARYDSAKPGYATANFTPTNYIIDGLEKVNPIGVVGRKIVVSGDIVFIDANTLYPLQKVIDDSRYRMDNIIISSHLLKFAASFHSNEAIIEFGRMRMKFITKSAEYTQNFKIDFGIGHIFQKVYMELVEKHSPEDSEKAVRYLQYNFKLSNLKFDYQIAPDITYNQVLEVFNKIASEYIEGVLLQVYKQGIEFKKIYSITNNYANDEWVRYLKSFLEIEVEEFKITSISGNFKQDLKVFNAIAINEKLRLKG